MMEYSAVVEGHLPWFYRWWSEKDRRRSAAVEAEKLGHGGVEDVSMLLGCDPKPIRQGREDLDSSVDPVADRVRKKGRDPNA